MAAATAVVVALNACFLEKEWTHHGLLLISGLHQMAECSSRASVEKEQIAEARIVGVKVRWSFLRFVHTESWMYGSAIQ